MKFCKEFIISFDHKIDFSASQLVASAFAIAEGSNVCILDSCGVGSTRSNKLIIGIDPVETLSVTNDDPTDTLERFESLTNGTLPLIFTLSYDFGMKLQRVKNSLRQAAFEPDLFAATFESLIVHDYEKNETVIVGDRDKCTELSDILNESSSNLRTEVPMSKPSIRSNSTKAKYLAAIDTVKERIRRGDTYQSNLTQQLTAKLPPQLKAPQIFSRLREQHPAPFAAYIDRGETTVVSASPELFFRVENGRSIVTSPIKGTRPRGSNSIEDNALREDLVNSPKDRAENTMIVDLLRNDLGRVCDFGSVVVEELCKLEEHPSLFHLVSTVRGQLRGDATATSVIKALFPCGSITGAPKISTMQIIDGIERTPRGLSMGSIGCFIPKGFSDNESHLELSVAIRTMVIRDQVATFNVGGGIVIDSDPESEYAETLTKATSLLDAIGGNKNDLDGV